MANAVVLSQAALQCSIVRSSSPSVTTCKRTFVAQLHSCGRQQAHGRRSPHKMHLTAPSSDFLSGGRPVSAKVATRTVSAPSRQGVRCMAEPEAQASEGTSADIWLGRAAMVAFTAVLTTEIVSGKGVFSLAGLDTPSPGLAVAVSIVLGGGAAFSILRSLFK